jgi:CBS domain-containing protein
MARNPVHRFLEATAGQYMTRKVKTVARDTTMRELHKMFEVDNFNCYPVREGDNVVGVVSNFDFLKCFAFNPVRMVPAYDDLLSRMVADVMTPEFIYVDPTTKLTRVLQLMVDHRMKSLPVLDADQLLVGIIAREDITRALAESVRGQSRSARWKCRYAPNRPLPSRRLRAIPDTSRT